MDEPNDHELIARFVSHRDESAFRQLYRRHSSAMYGVSARLLAPESDDLADVLQNAWFRAAIGLATFRGSSALRTWLIGIAINCCREQRRDRQRYCAHGEQAHSSETCHGPSEQSLDLSRALENLPDGYREVIVLHDVEGYTHEEIGEILGVAPGTSKSQLSRARRAVRAMLTGNILQSEEADELT